MPRREGSPNVTPAVRGAIKSAVKDHPELKSSAQIRGFLLKHHAHYGLLKDAIPMPRTIDGIKKTYTNPTSPEDKRIKREIEELARPWHLGLMGEYRDYIPVEAIPHIVRVQKQYDQRNLEILAAVAEEVERRKRRGKTEEPSHVPLSFVSIRQAMWISRLFAITKKSGLEQASWIYTHLEEESILSGEKHFDTSEWDKALREGALIEKMQERMMDVIIGVIGKVEVDTYLEDESGWVHPLTPPASDL